MKNALTRHISLRAGPWFLETLVKHYFERLFNDRKSDVDAAGTDESGKLRRDELLYDEVFHIVKSFLEVSTQHTIEELQQFSNTPTPSSPWMYVMRVRVPMSCCDDAAGYLIDVLGGEEKTRKLVGGTKWWQVRGVRGVDAQWIVARKDYQRVKKQQKQQQQQAELHRRDNTDEEVMYDPEMDDLRCILYFHGGGYYFGSVDQERFFIQRFARKSGCRLLAISYRLAPQYPFPCAIQDALASYLYLIRPPPDAPHTPVNPAHIIVSGDSAGGGLTFALLQVLRDSGLPLPAGAIPISPWCDLTHSFPSIHVNTETDVIPKYGLSIYKPSVLWPPPSDDLTDEVHAGIRTRIKQTARQYRKDGGKGANNEEPAKRSRLWRRAFSLGSIRETSRIGRGDSKGRTGSRNTSRETLADDARTGDVRAAAVLRSLSRQGKEETLDTGLAGPLPTVDDTFSQRLRVKTETGEVLEIHDQVHMYAPNNLLVHPLVSPAMAFLGGLPPILVIASDGEVLRDEIIYTAHKAAHPERYPVKLGVKKLYPKLEGIEERFGPTKVHLQVYDHAAHTFPVLFFVCNSAKFCFRAIATFSKFALGTLPTSPSPSMSNANGCNNDSHTSSPGRKSLRIGRAPSLGVSVSKRLSRMGSLRKQSSFHRESNEGLQPQPPQPNEQTVEHGAQVAESPGRLSAASSTSSTSERLDSTAAGEGVRLAGDSSVYIKLPDSAPSPFIDNMIRERISTRGEVRPLEPESNLTAFNMPFERIGMANELVLRRYLEGRSKWDERFAKTKEQIRKERAHSLRLASNDVAQVIPQLQMHFHMCAEESGESGAVNVKEALRPSAASWAWSWALDGAERPPPSSIVARRDTEEARRLSRIADLPARAYDHRMSGNNLWTYLVNRLSLEKTEAKVEQRTAEKDPKGVGKDASLTSLDRGRETEGARDASRERKRRSYWPSALFRSVSSPARRGNIFRFKSALGTKTVETESQETRVDGDSADVNDIGRVTSS